MDWSALETPSEVAAADEVLDAIDSGLESGFARLGAPARERLEVLASVFGGTPLAERVAAAVEACCGGHFTEDAFIALAAARESLQGARYDGLVAHANAAGGNRWNVAQVVESTPGPRPEGVEGLLAGARQWLVEIALAGFGRLDRSIVVPFVAALEELQNVPELVRVAAGLTGLVDELLATMPAAAQAVLPRRRWSDLWSRALLAAHAPPPIAPEVPVSGELRVLGADVRHHDHMASLVAYGALDGRIVRTTASRWKVDAISGDEVWALLSSVSPQLVGAIEKRKGLVIDDATVSAAGDLHLTGGAELGKAFDPIAVADDLLVAGAKTSVPHPLPVDRHPVQIALPLVCDAAGAPVATQRISPISGLGDGHELDRIFGLLRYDAAAWTIQPLAARGLVGKKRALVGPSASIAASRKIKKASSSVAVLEERASKLLRS